jgi:hypothetical protein
MSETYVLYSLMCKYFGVYKVRFRNELNIELFFTAGPYIYVLIIRYFSIIFYDRLVCNKYKAVDSTA